MLVNTGVRLVAEQAIQNYCVSECLGLIKKEGLQYILNPRDETHTAIYMFKYSCMKDVINFTLGKPYNKKALIHWINGKMFGYPDEEIDEYISKNS